MIIIETVIYVCLLIALLAVCDNQHSKKYYVPIKGACSASFLIICIINICIKGKPIGLIMPLAACFIGDIFMGLYNSYSKKKYIYGGIIAFVLAHLLFMNYLIASIGGTPGLILVLIPLFMMLILYAICRYCHLHMGRILYAGLIYCFFVSAMMIEAIYVGGLSKIAGILFFLSDFSIIFLYFYHFKKRTNKKIVHYFNLVTYYFAIFIFCLF